MAQDVKDRLNSWVATLGAHANSTEDNWSASHMICASGIYQALLEAILRDDEWTRDQVIVASVLDQAALQLEKTTLTRQDTARDVLCIIDRA